MIDDRILAGVEFRVCENTLTSRGIARTKIHPEAIPVTSGAAEIARLQCDEGFAYYKP
jgi:intracellular sulfur oxidation DsrE/DsrF family protein